MPPDLGTTAGGAISGVRDHVRWIPLSVSPSVSSVDTDTSSAASSDSDFSAFSDVVSPPISTDKHDAPSYFNQGSADFMAQVFPRANKVADRVVPVSAGEPSVWDLALLDDNVDGSTRTLYAKGASANLGLRDNLVQLLDLADESFGCDQVVVVLAKSDEQFAETLHSLMYVGGVVIPPSADSPLSKASSAYVLVGIDI